MRPNPNPASIKMPNGEILGVPVEVTGDELPGMVPPVAPVTDTASSPAADATATPTSPQASASSEPTASAAAEAGTQATEPESTTTSSAQTGEPAAEATP